MRNIVFLLKLLIGAVLIGTLFYLIDLGDVMMRLQALNTGVIALIFISSFGLILAQALRLHLLIKRYVPKYSTTLELTLIGQFFSNFLPGSVSGDIYKMVILKRRNASISSAVSLIALDRISGLVLVLLFGLFCLLWCMPQSLDMRVERSQFFNLLLFVAITGSLLWLIFKSSTTVREKWYRYSQTFREELRQYSAVARLVFLVTAIGTYGIRALKLFVILWAFGHPLAIPELVLLLFIVQMAGMIPLSVGGLGVIEASLVFGLGLFGISTDIGLAVALINRFTVWFFSLFGGVFWLRLQKQRDPEAPR